MTSPILAVSCGPSIVTWDLAQSTNYQSDNNVFDAKELSQYNQSIDYETGISTFQPHGSSHNVTGLVWNHNGQVIASCSDSTLIDSPNPNVVLTHFQTKSKLESFSNVQERAIVASPCTSISFGGKIAKSRYLCVSDAAGLTSIWDMKKIHRVRCFKSKRAPRPGVIRACIDPTDTFVASLHVSILNHNPTVLSSNIVLELFHLKTGALSMTLEAKGYQYGGAAHCFQFSELRPKHILAGTENGSLLLWDIESHRDDGGKSLTNHSSLAPVSTWTEKHSQAITDVAFSPIHSNLVATCSTDGSIAFHDLDSKTIQTVKPWDHTISNIPKKTRQGLTALAFHHDGYTWAVGTQDGLLFTYDLRQTEAGPLAILDVDRDVLAPVTCVRFMPPVVGGGGGVKNITSTVATTSDVKSPMPYSSHEAKDRDRSRTRNTTSNEVASSAVSQHGEAVMHTSFLSPHPSTSISDDPFVSPIANISKYKSSSQKKESAVKFDRNVHVHIPEIKVPMSQLHINESEKQHEEMTKSMDDMLQRIRNRSLQMQVDDVKEDDEENVEYTETKTKPAAQTSLSENTASVNLAIDGGNMDLQSPITLNDPKLETFKVTHEMMTISTLELQEMIEDAVESLRDDMEHKIQMVHGDFLRELQLQANETYALLEKQQQRVEQLILENSALKEENTKLKSFF